MADEPSTRDQSEETYAGALRYDDWPVDSIDDSRYLGVAGDKDHEPLMVYHATDHTVYEGRPDEESERIFIDEESSREFDEETTLSEIIGAIGDDIGWSALSEWAHTQGSTDPGQVAHVKFQKRNVLEEDAHEYGFFGSYTFTDDTDQVHTVERQFRVYTDSDYRVDGNPILRVEETHLVADAPQEERRVGDATKVGQTTTQLVLDVEDDKEGTYEENTIQEWCQEWHESHLYHPPT